MNLETLNWIDIALGGALIISALVGLMRGFLKEILSLIAWGVALYAAWIFAEPVAKTYVVKFLPDSYIAYVAAFGGIFIGVLFLIGIVNLLISQVLKATGLGFLDRLLGLILGTVRSSSSPSNSWSAPRTNWRNGKNPNSRRTLKAWRPGVTNNCPPTRTNG